MAAPHPLRGPARDPLGGPAPDPLGGPAPDPLGGPARDPLRSPTCGPLGELPITSESPPERGDAARNRTLLLDAARRLIAERGAEAVSTDDIANAAGVGKGTLFRRFGSRAGLMIVLLHEDETAHQQAFLFGPPPLGPGAPPLDRLLAYGRDRLAFVKTHHALLSDANRDPQMRFNAPATLHHRHVSILLEDAGTTGDIDAQATALLALLDTDYVHHQLTEGGKTLADLGASWESLARKLCGV